MPPKKVPPNRSVVGQSLGRFLSKAVLAVDKWGREQQEAEKRELAKAKIPWQQALLLFGIHIIWGLILATLQGAWAVAAWVLILGTSLYCTLLAVLRDADFLPDNAISFLIWKTLALPWTLMAEQMDAVLRRQILNTFRHDLAIDFWSAMAHIFCLVTLVGLDGLGLWAGYSVSTQL